MDSFFSIIPIKILKKLWPTNNFWKILTWSTNPLYKRWNYSLCLPKFNWCAQGCPASPWKSEDSCLAPLLCGHAPLPEEPFLNGNLITLDFLINSKIISHLMLVMFESFPTKKLTWKRLVLYVSPFKLLFQGWFYLEWEKISVYLEQFHLEDISIFFTTTPFLCSVFLAHCFLFWQLRSCSL